MQLSTMNKAQMMIVEAFAAANDEQEVNDLMDTLRDFYLKRFDQEMSRLWDNGTLDQKRLDELRKEHLRTPYRDRI